MNHCLRSLARGVRHLLVFLPFVLAGANAQVVFTNAGNVSISYVKDPADPDYGLGLQSLYFDLDRSGSVPVSSNWQDAPSDFDFYLAFFSRPGVNVGSPALLAGGADYVSASTVFVAAHNAYIPFAFGYDAGDVIGPGTFGGDGQYGAYFGFVDVFAADWPIGTTSYAGLRLGSHYGYAHVTWDGTHLILHDFAFEQTANTAIIAGAGAAAIPEPSAYATLAGLAAIGAVWRSRRRQSDAVVGASA